MLSKKQNGFTLVEILIVVVILGILAAIVIPQFTNASESAKSSSLISQLQTIRSQLELFQVQHNGNYPTLDNGWAIMTQNSDPTESVSSTADKTGDFGPYLQQDPTNPFTGTTTVAADTSGAWQYAAGSIKAVLPAGSDLAALGISANDGVLAGDGGDDG